jgi:hypothetical protein
MKCHVVDQSFPKRKGVKEEKVRSISTPGKRLRENQTKAAQGNHGEERVALGDYILDISIFLLPHTCRSYPIRMYVILLVLAQVQLVW